MITDSQKIEFLKDGIYLIESIHIPVKIDDWYQDHNYNVIFDQNLKFKMEEGHIFSWSKQHVTSEGRDKGVYPEHTSPVLTVVKVKNGIAEIISTPKATNLDFKTFKTKKIYEFTLADGRKLSEKELIDAKEIRTLYYGGSMEYITDKGTKVAMINFFSDERYTNGNFEYYFKGVQTRGKFEQKGEEKQEIGNYKYNFNNITIKNLKFNENISSKNIDLNPVIITNNEVRVSVNVTATMFDGWSNYDDWLQILLAQLCVYKIS